jgi:hypothetical protein
MPELQQITIAPTLTFDVLLAGKPGAPYRFEILTDVGHFAANQRQRAIAAAPQSSSVRAAGNPLSETAGLPATDSPFWMNSACFVL